MRDNQGSAEQEPQPMTAQDLLRIITESIELTSSEYACNGNHDSDLISNALDRLLTNIEFVVAKGEWSA